MRLHIERVPVQLAFCGLRTGCDATQHQADKQRQVTCLQTISPHCWITSLGLTEYES